MAEKSSDEMNLAALSKRLLATPPKPHKEKSAGPKPDASRLGVKSNHERSEPVKRSRKAK